MGLKFTDVSLSDEILQGIDVMGFDEMTPIQEQAIPVILEKKDMIACAQTGTGKTAAFLLPLINNLITAQHSGGSVNAIIMSPTRELAQQIDRQLEALAYFVPVSSAPVYGGTHSDAWEVQRRALQKGADVVIATPGRLISHLNLSTIDLSQVKYFILDEADRMLDMGFYDDIMNIVKRLPKKRQTLLFSATMPKEIRKLAKKILHKPQEIHLSIARPPEKIMQTAYICYEEQKNEILKHLFNDKTDTKTIIFSGKKRNVKELTRTLKEQGLLVGAMHSDLDQKEREEILLKYKNNHIRILVATDVMARGIDIDDIELVINYEVPYEIEDYVHRIGRTARAGDEGMAITLVASAEQFRFKKIEDFLEKEIFKIPLPHELGEAPAYNPTDKKKKKTIKGKKKYKKKFVKKQR